MAKLETDCRQAALRGRSERDDPRADQLSRQLRPISDSRSARQIAAAVAAPRADSPVRNKAARMNKGDAEESKPQKSAVGASQTAWKVSLVSRLSSHARVPGTTSRHQTSAAGCCGVCAVSSR